jgi:hypothetical protein
MLRISNPAYFPEFFLRRKAALLEQTSKKTANNGKEQRKTRKTLPVS